MFVFLWKSLKTVIMFLGILTMFSILLSIVVSQFPTQMKTTYHDSIPVSQEI